MFKRSILITLMGIGIFIPISPLKAQENCGGAIVNAKSLYELGKLNEVISELNPCLTHSLDRTNLWQGYKLKALAYLALNDKDNARRAAEDMLEINPLFKPSLLKDPKDFVELVNSIVIIPRFSLGISLAGGINNTYVDVMQSHTLTNDAKSYTNKLGWHSGFNVGYNISRNLEIGANILSSSKNYQVNFETAGYKISVNEKLSYLEVPILLKYSFLKSRLRPYVEAGAFGGYLLAANSDFKSTYTDGTVYSENNVSSDDRRNKTNFGLLFGAGLTYKTGPGGQLVLDIRYCMGLSNIVNTANRYADESVYFPYYYIDDDLRISNSLISIGYVKYINYKVVRSNH